MTSTPQLRPRLSGRDIIPILVSGLIVAGAMLVGGRSAFSVAEIAGALVIGVGFMLALAGIQGRAETLTPRAAVIGWIKLSVISAIVLLATGRLMVPGVPLRFAIFLGTSLGASLILYLLRTKRR
jgi:hypothetical protein